MVDSERQIIRDNLYAPRPNEVADPDRLSEIGIDFDDDLGPIRRPLTYRKAKRSMWVKFKVNLLVIIKSAF